jgi:hypothetical protein
MKTIIILVAIAILLLIVNKLANKVYNYNKKYPKEDKKKFYCWRDKMDLFLDDSCIEQCPRCKNVEDERYE